MCGFPPKKPIWSFNTSFLEIYDHYCVKIMHDDCLLPFSSPKKLTFAKWVVPGTPPPRMGFWKFLREGGGGLKDPGNPGRRGG